MSERLIDANGVELCTDTYGDPEDAPILLLAGLGGSMLWWEEGFCRLLADGERFVLRYDQRDTGRSTTYPHGQPDYDAADLRADALAVLDAFGVEAAHLVGVSAGAGMAQDLGLLDSDRVLSLTLISTSPVTATDRELPSPTEDFMRFVSSVSVDWEDQGSVIDYLVGYERMLSGDKRPFDGDARRELITRDAERARDYGAIQNHDVVAAGESTDLPPLATLNTPTLVIHGTADPMFPFEHGEALAQAIPGATLVRLPDAGHGLLSPDWETVAEAILSHTA